MRKYLIIFVLLVLAGCASNPKRFATLANYEAVYEAALNAGRQIAAQNKDLLNQKRIVIRPLWNESAPPVILVRDALNESISTKVWTLTVLPKTAAQETDQESPAPYILAYRLLDSGLDYGETKSGILSSSKIERIARTRLYYEILRGSNGEVVKSGRVEGIYKDIIQKDGKKFAENPDLPPYDYPDAKSIPAKPAAQEVAKETGGKSVLGKITGLFGGSK